MGEAKPFASLSSGLLARKGQAKPAMRPQGFGGFGMSATALEDLGWNDMGFERSTPAAPVRPQVSADVVPFAPPHQAAAVEEPIVETVAEVPTVVQQREAVEQAFEVEAAAPVRAPRAAPGSKGKAAFTLRLDPDRHLKLRLAAAVKHRSAQAIVVAALDAYLARNAPADPGLA